MNLPFENDTNAIVKKLANRSMKAGNNGAIFCDPGNRAGICAYGGNFLLRHLR